MTNIKNENISAKKALQKQDNVLTIGDIRTVFSWYDPFGKFVLKNTDDTFRLEQITNGSVYVGKEADGTTIIYSLDLVASLTFRHNHADMTSMIIFPGMYLRFDPLQNSNLKGADLFRIIQVLGGQTELINTSENTTHKRNTGIEFIDPRAMSTANEPIRVLRLSRDSQPLFNALSAYF